MGKMVGEREIEVWADIKNYEGCYQVSNLGRVRSLDRYGVNNWGNAPRLFKGRVLKPGISGSGYQFVNLQKDGVSENARVHRLVAETFIPNPLGLEEVNHKDENKTNNRVDNLEWCDRVYNANYGTVKERAGKKVSEWLKKNGHPMTGKKHSEETKKKISEAKTKYTEEELKEHTKKYRQEHREHRIEYFKKYREEHKDELRNKRIEKRNRSNSLGRMITKLGNKK